MPNDHSQFGPSLGSVPTRHVKLVLDKTLSLVFLVLTLPISLAAVVAVKVYGLLDSRDRGPLFYTETRVSQGRPFPLVKFRIFRVEAIEKIRAGAITKVIENNPENLTRVGRFLKKFGLDELPQLYSILVGDMSFVGPRPKPTVEYELQVEAGQWHRTVIRAGLTGPAQLLKGTKRTSLDEIAADIDYIEKCRTLPWWALARFDLGVLWQTVVLLKGGPDE